MSRHILKHILADRSQVLVRQFHLYLSATTSPCTEQVQGCQRHNIHYHTEEEVRFKRLLLRFMAKELLAENGARPAADNTQYQQGGLRYSAPGFAGRHFVHAINYQRQRAGEQGPRYKGM